MTLVQYLESSLHIGFTQQVMMYILLLLGILNLERY
jgi:hypothetical protein